MLIHDKQALLKQLEDWCKEHGVSEQSEAYYEYLGSRLCLAVMMHPVYVVESLVNSGADPFAIPKQGLSAHQLALAHDRKDVIHFFQEYARKLQLEQPVSKSPKAKSKKS